MGRDYKDHLIGSATAVATSMPVGTSPVLLAPAADRVRLDIYADVAGHVGVSPTFTASTLRVAPIATGGKVSEPDFKGAVYGKSEGATGVFQVFDVRPAGG